MTTGNLQLVLIRDDPPKTGNRPLATVQEMQTRYPKVIYDSDDVLMLCIARIRQSKRLLNCDALSTTTPDNDTRRL